jgi:hypothetical protein
MAPKRMIRLRINPSIRKNADTRRDLASFCQNDRRAATDDVTQLQRPAALLPKCYPCGALTTRMKQAELARWGSALGWTDGGSDFDLGSPSIFWARLIISLSYSATLKSLRR